MADNCRLVGFRFCRYRWFPMVSMGWNWSSGRNGGLLLQCQNSRLVAFAYSIYVLFCIGFAYLNARWIKADRPIKHGWNGLAHFAVWMALAAVFDWWLLVAFPFIGKIVFDIALNKFRRLSTFYYSEQSTSILDDVEIVIFEDTRIAKTFYLLFTIDVSFLI